MFVFRGQVLRDGKEASCQSAVARIVCHCLQVGRQPPTADTGDYCRARAKLSTPPIGELCYGVAQSLEQAAKQLHEKQRATEQHHGGEDWFWNKRHAYLIDGFTFTASDQMPPDSPSNRAAFPHQTTPHQTTPHQTTPHQTTQTPGVGFPIARAVAIVSLATGCLMRAAYGPCVGKGTGEAGLVRSLLDLFEPGTVAVADKYYCSYMLIALLSQREAAVCFRKHQRRHTDFGKDADSASTTI